VIVSVIDDGPGFGNQDLTAGHGLDNLQERLLALFGDLAKLSISVEQGRTIVSIALPLGARPPDLSQPSRIGDKIEFVEVARVTHFYASDKLTYAATPKTNYVIDRTISELEETLDAERFIRIHRSTIVNLECVKELHSWFAERLMVRLDDGKGTELTVARDRVKRLKDKLGL
jgi:DNA-binding LytR/AlgR family response regulator